MGRSLFTGKSILGRSIKVQLIFFQAAPAALLWKCLAFRQLGLHCGVEDPIENLRVVAYTDATGVLLVYQVK